MNGKGNLDTPDLERDGHCFKTFQNLYGILKSIITPTMKWGFELKSKRGFWPNAKMLERNTFLAGCFCFTLTAFSLFAGDELIWSNNFDKGLEGVSGYRKAERLEIGTDDSAGAVKFVRATVAGKEPLEGIVLEANTVEGDRLAIITAKVRGKGIMMPMAKALNGWTRLPPLTLTNQWQDIKIPKTLKAGPNHLIIYFLTSPANVPEPGAIFEVANVQVRFAPRLRLGDSEVTAKRFGAGDIAANRKQLREEDGISFLSGPGTIVTTDLPFPQTRRLISVYVRYRAATKSDKVFLYTRSGGVKQMIREMKPEAADGQWHWMHFQELTADEVGESMIAEASPNGDSETQAGLDSIVFSTNPGLGDSELDAAAR